MTAPASRLLLISCPADGCGAWVRTVLTDPWTADQRCPGCGAHFIVPPCEVPESGEVQAPVELLRLPSHEGEHVEVRLDGAFVVALVGRLDLFSSEVLAKAWNGLPRPRRAVFDLGGATELTAKGVAALVGLCGLDGPEGRAVIRLRAHDADQGRAFAGTPLLCYEKEAALLALGDIPEESRRMPTLTIRREASVTATLPSEQGGKSADTAPEEPKPSPQPRRRRLEVEDIGDVTVVNFVDKKLLDEQNIQIIGEQLFDLVDKLGRRKILLNFGNVEYMSSAMHGKFIVLNKKLQRAGGRLILCSIDPQIYEVFEITKLDKFYRICREEQEALQLF